MTRKRNLSIDYMRMIAAILVVIIHTPPFMGINPLLDYSILQVLPRIAVPFFFAISGFYFMKASKEKQLKQILNIVKEYCIISLVYTIFKIVLAIVTHSELEFSVFGFIFNFFTVGVEYHLWFFPALIYSMLFVYLFSILFNKISKKNVSNIYIYIYR